MIIQISTTFTIVYNNLQLWPPLTVHFLAIWVWRWTVMFKGDIWNDNELE